MLELVVLGAPTVIVDGANVTLPTKKALALVAYLALEGPTPRARLADVLWPSVEPDKARSNLRRELNRLRQTPLGAALLTEGNSIALVEPFRCDALEMIRCVDQGDTQAALSLCRGPLLDGLELYDADGFDAWLARRREALAERHRTALAAQAQVRESAGDLRGALQVNLDLIRLDPKQERFHRDAMRLHYLVGEREAALERFAELKRVLRRELALEPLPETLELYRSIQKARSIQVESPPPSKPLRLSPPLVGREREWKAIVGAREPLVAVVAEAGLGKTRLVVDLAGSLGDFLVARAGVPLQATALYPFASMLLAALDRPRARARIDQLDVISKREVARLVPDLTPETRVETAPSDSRARFLESVARACAAAVGPGGTLVLDDIHGFDTVSVELLAHLVRRASALGIRLLATARPAELRDSPTAEVLRRLEGEGLARTLTLGPLTDRDLLALVRALSGQGGALRFAKRLFEHTLGNPLFALETLKSLLASGEIAMDERGWHTRFDEAEGDYAQLPVPAGVRDAVLGQIESLGAAVRRLLEAASLAGSSFELGELAGATGLGSFESVDALERAVDAGFLIPDGGGFRFHHELVRRSLSEAMGGERRKLLHARLAEALALRERSAPAVAEHFAAAGNPAAARAFRLLAAEGALRLFAHDEALGQWAAVLDGDPPQEQAVDAHLKRAAVFRVLDDRVAWSHELDVLEARLRGAPPAASARLLLARAELASATGQYDAARAHADAARSCAGAGPAIAARAELECARALLGMGRGAEARPLMARALELGGDADSSLQSEVHRLQFAEALERNDLPAAQAANDGARAADEARGDRHGLVLARINDGTIRRRGGELAQAVSALGAALDEAHAAGLSSLERSALLALASTHNLLGEYDRAAELAERGMRLATEPEDPALEARFSNALAAFDYSRGKLGSSIVHSRRAIEVADRIGSGAWTAFFRYGLAHTLLEVGAHLEAEGILEQAGRAVESLGLTGHQVVLESHRAHVEIRAGRPREAVRRIETVLSSDAPPSLDADYTFAVLALAQFDAGCPLDALATLARHEFRPLHRSRALAVAIDARRALGEDFTAELGQARELLRDPRLTPVEALELWRSVLRDPPRGWDTAELGRPARLASNLLETLVQHEALAAAFRRHNHDWLTSR